MARNMQEFSFTHQIELLPWLACSPNLSPIENVGCMLPQRLARDTPSATTPDQLWKFVKAVLTAVSPKDTSKASLILCRGVW
ncbi:transposable element Tcb1 transposase [Trichonephila clavipes]|nr:transposable element Tcb1 transposase [Trichonephila clavipes]